MPSVPCPVCDAPVPAVRVIRAGRPVLLIGLHLCGGSPCYRGPVRVPAGRG